MYIKYLHDTYSYFAALDIQSGRVCVPPSVSKSFLQAGAHQGPKGAVANEDLLWDPCKRTCIFLKNV